MLFYFPYTKKITITDAEHRLQQLEAEKKNLDAELKSAREKVRRAEEAQILLEAEIVTVRPTKGRERIRRTQSFIPTTKEKPLLLLEERSMTLRKHC